MKRSWEKDLPRKQYEQFKKIEQSQPWFTVYDIRVSAVQSYFSCEIIVTLRVGIAVCFFSCPHPQPPCVQGLLITLS